MHTQHPRLFAPVPNPAPWVWPTVVLGAVAVGAVGYVLLRPSRVVAASPRTPAPRPTPLTPRPVEPTSVPQIRLNVVGSTPNSIRFQAADHQSAQRILQWNTEGTEAYVPAPSDVLVSLPSAATSEMYATSLKKAADVALLSGDPSPSQESPSRDWLFRIREPSISREQPSVQLTIAVPGGWAPLLIYAGNY